MNEKRLAEIRERLEKASGDLQFMRYPHGGGRAFSEPGDERHLVMDCFSEPDREFYFHARQDIPFLLEELERLSGLLEASEKMAAKIEKVAAWLDDRAEQSRNQAKASRGRFDSLADACDADAKNYAATARDMRSVVNKEAIVKARGVE